MGTNSIVERYNGFKNDVSEKNTIINLQEEFEKGKILEENLSENQRKELEKLYDEQIKEIEMKIIKKRKELIKITREVNGYYMKILNEKK